MKIARIVVLSSTETLLHECKSACRSSSFVWKYHSSIDKDAYESIKEADVLLTEPSLLVKACSSYNLTSVSEIAPQCKFVQSTWAGIDSLIPFWKQKDNNPLPILSRFGGGSTLFGEQAREWCFSHILAHHRKLFNLLQAQNDHIWKNHEYTNEKRGNFSLSGKTLGLLGYGEIAKKVSSTARHGFEMKVIAYVNDIESHKQEKDVELYSGDGLSMVLSQSDYIVSILPSTASTTGLLDKDILSVCKPTAVLLNMGRGNLLSEKSILEAVNKNYLDSIVLDVFPSEPLPRTSPLWDEPRVVISPHVAALSDEKRVAELFLTNLEKIHSKQLPSATVCLDKNY